MIGISASTWGIGGTQFLWGYGLVSAGAAVAIADGWRRALRAQRGDGSQPDLCTYDLALLNGGPRMVVMSAAADLYREGQLTVCTESGTLSVAGELDPAADPIEHEVLETVRGRPGIHTEQLCEIVAEGDEMRRMSAELTAGGLLIEESRRSALLKRLWIVSGLLVTIGAFRILAGIDAGNPVGYLLGIVIALAAATAFLTHRAPRATSRGRAELERWRAGYDGLRRQALPGQTALGAALFGGVALWLAAPEIASAFGVPREASGGGSGDGGGGSGSGWFGDGGWFGGDGGGCGGGCGCGG